MDISEELKTNLRTLEPAAYREYVERRAAEWITNKITESLLYQQASLRVPSESGPRIDKYVDGEIRRIITDRHGGIERRYEKYLASNGLTIDDVHAKLRRQIIIADYFESEIRPRIVEPTRADLYAIFEANVDSWRRPPRRRMSLIDVRVLDHLPEGVDNPTRQEHEAARAGARSIIAEARRAVRRGMSFAEAAQRYSDGLHAAEGGAWGWVSPGSVRERFEPAVAALGRLGAGETSDVIEIDDGFFLVHCDELDPGFEPSFENVQPELKERHSQLVHARLVAELVANLRQNAALENADLVHFHGAVVEAALQGSTGSAAGPS